MLRNPVDMAPSLHEELVFTGREDVADFAEAWNLQEARRAGRCLPVMVWEPRFVQYGDLCSLGRQVARLLEIVPASRVKFLLLEDVARDPAAAYCSVLQFLEVSDDHRQDFRVHNQAKTRRWRSLVALAWAVSTIKSAMGIERGLGIWKRIDTMNRVERPRPMMADDTRRILKEYFAADVVLLQSLIGRDLRHWQS
jgi:hypothetical protein